MQLISAVPDAPSRALVAELVARVADEDGAPPLSDDALTNLDAPDVTHVLATDGSDVVGYAQRRNGSAEVVALPSAVGQLLDAITEPGLLIWSHGRRSRLASVLSRRGFTPVRELHQLRRPMTDVPAEPILPPGVELRPFRPGIDEQDWLAVNAAAFATHPEQGRQTRTELRALMAQPWFAPSDFLLAWRAGELLGFHWMKLHSDGNGEVYVLGVAPAAQGLGLGRVLLAAGLRHLAARGCPTVLLYVDGDNTAARRLYESTGFVPYELDVQWQAPVT